MTDDRDDVCTEEEQAGEKAYQHELKSLKPGLLIPRRANSLKELPLGRLILPINGEGKGRYIHPAFQAKTAKIEGRGKGRRKRGLAQWRQWRNVQWVSYELHICSKSVSLQPLSPLLLPCGRQIRATHRPRRDGRVVDCGGLENR